MSAVESAVAASFVTGRTNGTWSISCSEPCPQRICGARPPSTSIGEWFCSAPAIALMPFVTPGPAVSAATPGSRVTFAQPSAANAAACSWRTSTMSMPSSRQPSYIENRWPPESVNSFETPWAFSRRATRRPPWSWVVCWVSVDMAGTLLPAERHGVEVYAAVDADQLAGDRAGRLARQEGDECRDLVGLDQPAGGQLLGHSSENFGRHR